MSERRSVTCVVADDHPAVLDALLRLLPMQGIEVVGSARTAEEAIETIEEHEPDVVLLDLHMPVAGGAELVARLAADTPGAAIVAYTGDSSRGLAAQVLEAGARGILSKQAPLADIPRAIQTVLSGGLYVDPLLTPYPVPGKGAGPTPREREVLKLLAEGLRNEEIGARLFISSETVRDHVRSLMRKLEAKTRTEAVATALRRSLIH
jgi:DNA-binding NarL/FixJ family response regulator